MARKKQEKKGIGRHCKGDLNLSEGKQNKVRYDMGIETDSNDFIALMKMETRISGRG